MPPDPADIRVLTPRVRRAADGPTATSSAAVSSTLTDEQVKDLTADAIADVILYTGGVFGKTLNVTARDAAYGAPSEYATSAPLSLEEATVIASQAALSYWFHRLREMKVSERIKDEAQEWEYSLSANVVRDLLRELREARDRALEAIRAKGTVNLDTYASFLATRDAATSLAVEPWVDEAQGIPIWADTRF